MSILANIVTAAATPDQIQPFDHITHVLITVVLISTRFTMQCSSWHMVASTIYHHSWNGTF